jgi:hypothetical protein
MKLFMFYVGGNFANSNVELHDVRFSIGQTPEDCHDDLRRQWWGDPKSLHLDCWGAVEQADGYDIELSTQPPEDVDQKLFFVNLGGYDPSAFTELHKNVLIVSPEWPPKRRPRPRSTIGKSRTGIGCSRSKRRWMSALRCNPMDTI